MPTITANLIDIGRLSGLSMSADELEEKLRLAKGELKEYDPETGEVRIELNDTNRPDLWCAEGIARQIRTHVTGEAVRYPFFGERAEPTLAIDVDPALESVRPFVAAFAASGPAVTDDFLVQIIQTQEKLCENYGRRRRNVAIGIYNAEAIRFPVQYTAAQRGDFTFTPLGFEEAVTLDRILEEHPKGKEYGHLVKDLPACPILADADGTVLSFPPIINSRETGEVKVGDSHLFVEATGWDMRQLLLSMNIMAAGFADRGFSVEPVLTRLPYDSEFGREVAAPFSMSRTLQLPLDKFSQSIGEAYTPDDLEKGLKAYGVDVALKGDLLEAVCPPYRDDYLHPMDVVEDFAISRGYDSFDPVLPSRFTVGMLHPVTILGDRVRDQLVGSGFQEVFSNILSNRDVERDRMLIPDEPIVSIENIMSETYSVLRSSIIPSLLRVEAQSSKALYPHRLFETGDVCEWDPENDSGSRTAQKVAALWASADSGFSEIHSVMDMLLYYLVKPYELRPADLPFYFEGRAGEVICGGRPVGHIGEMHPAVLTHFGITMPCAAFEIDLDLL